jgi:septum site-determining protein MinC
MAMTKPYVTIKGTKDGLVFIMDDTCSYQDLILELTNKLDASNQHFLDGPVISVTVRLGNRYLNPEQEDELKSLIRSKGNLIIDRLECFVVSKDEIDKARLMANIQIINKTIRSGQVYQRDGNVLILGDINPGGCIQASGSIYVMGSLKGMAHAGYQGDDQSIIAASTLQPTQLRIASVVSRPPDEWEEEQYQMEFAYIDEGQIVVEKLHHLAEIRPELKRFV